jgi:hypothetical protein
MTGRDIDIWRLMEVAETLKSSCDEDGCAKKAQFEWSGTDSSKRNYSGSFCLGHAQKNGLDLELVEQLA